MPIAQKVTLLTPDEYIRSEEEGDIRHEYVNGYIYAKASASRRHNLIAMALVRLLGDYLQGKSCRTYMADMKLNIRTAGIECFYYPDLMVSYDSNPPHDYYEDKPALLIEVLSATTEARDRLEKLAAYTSIPSLVEYMLVGQDWIGADIYRRVGENWVLNTYKGGEVTVLESVNLSLPIDQIYMDVIGQV
ncbi:Uma2 family endonuclease [Exilibacterium tricleocarpae]|uniref:Uma2 family endonuclease n=1 Tax=Exilibacterium tricleocarpae TaxID=2591008 RepID=A0A545U435_9GAMM|nr:Uma2 family endonuclease [Exilibacterium tricleocarpae]TQV84218.1 Uma2 family endonuclease [Exilibacterium tricleocarpae]